jgi:hypothetical protein
MSTPSQTKPVIFHAYAPLPIVGTMPLTTPTLPTLSTLQAPPSNLKPLSIKTHGLLAPITIISPNQTVSPSLTTPITNLKLEPIQREDPVQTKTIVPSHDTASRGNLPKDAVEVLRKWLYAHFDHPYPSDVDKEDLMKETNLSMTQVNNWFINARRRIWKPQKDQKEGKPEKEKVIVPAEGKIPLFVPSKHPEEKRSKRTRPEQETSENITDSSDDETDQAKFDRITHENQILKEELKSMQNNLSQMVKDFSSRNDALMKQVGGMEHTIWDLQVYNQDLVKKINDLTGSNDLSLASFQRPIAVKKTDSSFFILHPTSEQTENASRKDEVLVAGTKTPACK